LHIYTGQQIHIPWNGVYSPSFDVKNGVKQGGTISPILFSLYLDEIHNTVCKSGIGCYVGTQFAGAMAYADNIVLLAPSANAMRRMLAICDDYAQRFHMKFNADKSKCLIFWPPPSTNKFVHGPSLFISNRAIENVAKWLHLGHVIESNSSDDSDILRRRGCLIRQINNVLCNFSKLYTNT
jgi:Reverse transcriptase (RNA-dependent DNA polymerase)